MTYYLSNNRPRPLRPAAIPPGYRGFVYLHTQNMFFGLKLTNINDSTTPVLIFLPHPICMCCAPAQSSAEAFIKLVSHYAHIVHIIITIRSTPHSYE